MVFKIAQNLSEDSLVIEPYLLELSNHLEKYFYNKNYTNKIEEAYVGVICVNKKFDSYFQPINLQFNKKKKVIEIETKLEHSIINLSENERNELIRESVLQIALLFVDYLGEEYKGDLLKVLSTKLTDAAGPSHIAG